MRNCTIFILINIFALSSTYGQNLETMVKLKNAQKAFTNEEYQEAVKLYSELVSTCKTSEIHYYYYGRANSYYKLTKYNESFEDLAQALKVKKSNNRYYWIKGNCYWMMARIHSKTKDPKQAYKNYKKALKYYRSSELYSSIAYAEIKLQKYEKAIENLEKAIELDENNAYAHNNIALAYLNLDMISKAQESVKRSIELNPENPYAFKHSAMINLKLEQLDNACADLQKAKELGYSTFSNEADSEEVQEMIDLHCSDQ